MKTIQEIYRERCCQNGDINEHLPMLYYLSQRSAGVAEFGVGYGVSASALIAGQDDRDDDVRCYHGVDPSSRSKDALDFLRATCDERRDINRNKVLVYHEQRPSTEIPCIFPLDLLLIDSLHTEETIRKELELHLFSARRFVALHDTVTFGEVGELPGTRGLIYGMGALRTRDWRMIYDSPRNNGFTVFERVI